MPDHHQGLGLNQETLLSHIAWDLGALVVAKNLADILDCPLVFAGVSRLLYDCNRPPEAVDAIPSFSEIYEIPGNYNLSDEERNWRVENIYHPFHRSVDSAFDAHTAASKGLCLVTIHSFTPVYKGQTRKVEIGILHDSDQRLADRILTHSETMNNLIIARNEPYSACDGVTHTLQKHGISKDRRNVMIEIRNDLISNTTKAGDMAAWFAPVLREAVIDVLEREPEKAGP